MNLQNSLPQSMPPVFQTHTGMARFDSPVLRTVWGRTATANRGTAENKPAVRASAHQPADAAQLLLFGATREKKQSLAAQNRKAHAFHSSRPLRDDII